MDSKPLLSDQVRAFLRDDPRSYYRFSCDAGIHRSTATRFADGEGVRTDVLDKIATALGLVVVRAKEEQ